MNNDEVQNKKIGNGKMDGWDGAINQLTLFGRITSEYGNKYFSTRGIKIPFGLKERNLWYTLWDLANRQYWRWNTFKATNKQLCKKMGVSEKTLIEARRNLEELGFACMYIQGNSSNPSTYMWMKLTEEVKNGIYQISNPVREFIFPDGVD